MRRKRSLTSSERWELGLFLAMMIVGCLCIAVILNLNTLPKLFAVFSPSPASPTLAPSLLEEHPTPAKSFSTPTIDLAPQPFPIGDSFISNLLPTTPTIQIPDAPRSRIAPSHPTPETKIFNGQKYRLAKTLRLRVTAYAPDVRCTWPYPGTTTASGLSVKTNHGKLVAADTSLIPLHALVSVPGYANNTPVPVLDRGGAIKGRRLDLLMPTFNQAKDWGTKSLEVKIYLPL